MTTYIKDTKPVIGSAATWATIATTWATEIGTWANVSTGVTYSNDVKP